jgi:ribosomal protein S18 acetylase RimI-like enzyme
VAVDVASLGYRTDLALLQLAGSRIEDRGDHLVIRTPRNPTFWWGNFLLLDRVPQREEADAWLARFAAAFPDARHVTFGIDGTDGRVGDLAVFTERGLGVEAQTVMTATAVHPPAHPGSGATYRPLVSDADWAQSVTLRLDCDDRDAPSREVDFVQRRTASNRVLTETGRGSWFGAFVDGRLVSQMGLVAAGPQLARFQSVETHPDFRGRGFAGSLLHHASEYGFGELGARTLVMVADPDYLAIRLYRSVGFADTERQLQAERPPPR